MPEFFPVELLRVVLTHIDKKRDLLALSEVSTWFRSFVFERLFKVLTLNANDETCLWDLSWHPYFDHSAIIRAQKVLAAVEELHFRAPFELTKDVKRVNKGRCRHSLYREMYEWVEKSPPFTAPWRVLWDDKVAASRERKDGVYLEQDFEEFEGFKDSERADLEMMELAMKMTRLLSALPERQLTSFSWDMGTCFPKAILGENGYLVAHQNSIRKLSLITEFGCASCAPPLKDFTNLQELSWKGHFAKEDFHSLKKFFELHHERLTYLELDFINWYKVSDHFDWGNRWEMHGGPLTEYILPVRLDNYENFFPNLQTLLLSMASFRICRDRLINAFNLSRTQKLRFINCECSADLLSHIARTNVHLSATSFEFVFPYFPYSSWTPQESVFFDFLAPFHGLEDLFLMFRSYPADELHAQIILHHRDTLRRLVYHRQRRHSPTAESYWERYCDASLEVGESDGIANILVQSRLESLGVSGEPSMLQQSFQTLASEIDSLKLLHLRFAGHAEQQARIDDEYGRFPEPNQSITREAGLKDGWDRWQRVSGVNWLDNKKPELETFADWAFSPKGFPRLQVLASGDFSHGNRFADTRTIWCRNTRGSHNKKAWHTIEESDITENEMIDANIDMLSACPATPLF